MAAGSLPAQGSFSINDINLAFYSAANTKTLSGLAADARIDLPAGIRDFYCTRVCCVWVANPLMEWDFDLYGPIEFSSSYLEIVPDKTFTVYSTPDFVTNVCNQTTNTICIYPNSVNSETTRAGRVCMCATTGGYDTSFICVIQFSQFY